jgi:hypothetical protein
MKNNLEKFAPPTKVFKRVKSTTDALSELSNKNLNRAARIANIRRINAIRKQKLNEAAVAAKQQRKIWEDELKGKYQLKNNDIDFRKRLENVVSEDDFKFLKTKIDNEIKLKSMDTGSVEMKKAKYFNDIKNKINENKYLKSTYYDDKINDLIKQKIIDNFQKLNSGEIKLNKIIRDIMDTDSIKKVKTISMRIRLGEKIQDFKNFQIYKKTDFNVEDISNEELEEFDKVIKIIDEYVKDLKNDGDFKILKESILVDNFNEFKRIDDLISLKYIDINKTKLELTNIVENVKKINDPNAKKQALKLLETRWNSDYLSILNRRKKVNDIIDQERKKELFGKILIFIISVGAISYLTGNVIIHLFKNKEISKSPGTKTTEQFSESVSTPSSSPPPSPSIKNNEFNYSEFKKLFDDVEKDMINSNLSKEKRDNFKLKLQNIVSKLSESQIEILNDEFLNINLLDLPIDQFIKLNFVLKGDKSKRLKQYILTKGFYDNLSNDDKTKFKELSEESSKLVVAEYYKTINDQMKKDKEEMINLINSKNEKSKSFFQKYLIVIIIVFVMILILVGFLVLKPAKVDYLVF